MNDMKLFEAIGMIDDDLVREAELPNETSGPADNADVINSTVSGVEPYRSPKWHKILAAAAAFVLLFGAVSGGTFLLSRRDFDVPDNSSEETTTITAAASDTTALPETTTVQSKVTSAPAAVSGTAPSENKTTTAAVTARLPEETTTFKAVGSSAPASPVTTAANVYVPAATTVTTAAPDTDSAPESSIKNETHTTTAPVTTAQAATSSTAAPPETTDVTTEETLMWFDRLSGNYPTDIQMTMTLPEFPNTVFTWHDECIYYTENGSETTIEGGFAITIFNSYFTDINGDGYPELCLSEAYGSGIGDMHITVYDHHNQKTYHLWDRMINDYILYFIDGELMALRLDFETSMYTGYGPPNSFLLYGTKGKLAIVKDDLVFIETE